MKRHRQAAPGSISGAPVSAAGAPATARDAPSRMARLVRDPLVATAALLIAARLMLDRMVPVAAEDAYITFRYARNLALGEGLVYNRGEHVMGFTSPLWTLWIALGLPLLHDPELWTRSSALVLGLVTLACTVRVLERNASQGAAWAFGLAFAGWPFFASLGASGLEMDLMLALMALSMWLIERGSPLSGVALGALALTRPEALVAAMVLAVPARMRDRLIALGIVGAGLLALSVRFGSPLPNSMLAKAGVYGTPGPWAGRVWWEWLFPIDLGRVPDPAEPLQLWPLRVLLAPAVAAGLWSWRRTRALALPLAGVAVWAGYAVLGVAYFFWYFALPAYVTAVLAAVGLTRVTRGPWVPLAAGLFVLGAWSIIPLQTYHSRALSEARLFGGMAEMLQHESKPGETLLAEPIGFIGWYNPELRIVDETGLVSPQVWHRRRQGAGWYADLVAEVRPAWILTRTGFLESGAAFAGAGRAFRNQAEAARTFADYDSAFATGRRDNEAELVLYRRRP